jgi:hypothetical protein
VPHYLYSDTVACLDRRISSDLQTERLLRLTVDRNNDPTRLLDCVDPQVSYTQDPDAWFDYFASQERLWLLVYGDLTAADWQGRKWPDFLNQYAHRLRNRGNFRLGPHLLVVLPGILPIAEIEKPREREPFLQVSVWQNRSSWSDLFTWAHMVLSDCDIPAHEYRLTALLAATLACYDPYVCLKLAVADQRERLNPELFLQQMITDMQIAYVHELALDDLQLWQLGLLDWQSGEKQLHSAYLGYSQPEKYRRRIWEAQAAVLLPAVEQKTRQIVQQLIQTRQIRLPMDKTTFNHVASCTDAEQAFIKDYDLDIAAIDRLLSCRKRRDQQRIPEHLHSQVFRLKNCRNLLAHQGILSASEMSEVLSPISI